MARPLPVLVCDDRPRRLREVVTRLRTVRGLVLVDTPASGEEPQRQCRRLQPRVVLFGVTSTSLAAFAVLRRQAEGAVFVAVIGDDGLRPAVLAAGADHVVSAGGSLEDALRDSLGADWPGDAGQRGRGSRAR